MVLVCLFIIFSCSVWHMWCPCRTRFIASRIELLCSVRLFVLRETVIWSRGTSSGWVGSWAKDVCPVWTGGHLTATHHLGVESTHTEYWAIWHHHPPTHSLVLTLGRSPHTSLFTQTNKTERSSFNHVTQGLEKVFYVERDSLVWRNKV